jgi:hypothetical protein
MFEVPYQLCDIELSYIAETKKLVRQQVGKLFPMISLQCLAGDIGLAFCLCFF